MNSVQKMNLDLHRIIDQMDAEALENQMAMESDMEKAEYQRRLLEDRIEDLESRCAALSSELQVLKTREAHPNDLEKGASDRDLIFQKVMNILRGIILSFSLCGCMMLIK